MKTVHLLIDNSLISTAISTGIKAGYFKVSITYSLLGAGPAGGDAASNMSVQAIGTTVFPPLGLAGSGIGIPVTIPSANGPFSAVYSGFLVVTDPELVITFLGPTWAGSYIAMLSISYEEVASG